MTLEENYKKGTKDLLYIKHIPDGIVNIVRNEVETLQQQKDKYPYLNFGLHMLSDNYCKECEHLQIYQWNKLIQYMKLFKPYEVLFTSK